MDVGLKVINHTYGANIVLEKRPNVILAKVDTNGPIACVFYCLPGLKKKSTTEFTSKEDAVDFATRTVKYWFERV